MYNLLKDINWGSKLNVIITKGEDLKYDLKHCTFAGVDSFLLDKIPFTDEFRKTVRNIVMLNTDKNEFIVLKSRDALETLTSLTKEDFKIINDVQEFKKVDKYYDSNVIIPFQYNKLLDIVK